MEIWKDIEGYEGLYQVSNLGRIKSLPRIKYNHNKPVPLTGCIMSACYDTDGYLLVRLSKNGIKRMHKVHRLVAKAFIPNPQNKPVVDHIDCVRDNNVVDNLRWATIRENNDYALQNGNMGRDELGRFCNECNS